MLCTPRFVIRRGRTCDGWHFHRTHHTSCSSFALCTCARGCSSQLATWGDCVRAASAQRAAGHRTLALSAFTQPSSPSLSLSNRTPRPRLLISACLLGHRVVYHGRAPSPARARRSQSGEMAAAPMSVLQHLLGDLYGFVELVPLCPEVQLLGLGVPRPPVHLARAGACEAKTVCVRVSSHSGETLLTLTPESTLRTCFPPCTRTPTDAAASAQAVLPRVDCAFVEALMRGIDGVVLKSRSPSCGVRDARLYHTTDGGSRTSAWEPTDGFFTQLLRRQMTTAGEPAMVVTTERQLRVLDGANADEVQLVLAAERAKALPIQPFDASPENTLMLFVEQAFARCAARQGGSAPN